MTTITWANPVANTASASLTSAIVASSGMSPEFLAGIVEISKVTVKTNNWVATIAPLRENYFWGRTSLLLTAATPVTRLNFNERTFYADRIVTAFETTSQIQDEITWNDTLFNAMNNDQVVTSKKLTTPAF